MTHPIPTVELLHFPGCPNVPAARDALRRAMLAAGLPAQWTEVDVTADNAPPHVRGYGSPTVLVNGRDVTGAPPGDAATCRVYAGTHGAPPVDAMLTALRAASAGTTGGTHSLVAAVPGALLAALPVVGCPSCWPAYAGVLSALGVPFLMDTAWFAGITALAMALAVGALAWRARARRGYGPALVGALAAAGVMVSKFALGLEVLAWAGAGLLLGASAWNAWPRERADACDSCSA